MLKNYSLSLSLSQKLTVRDPQPVLELRLDRQLLQPPVDLGAAPVHQHGPDPDAREQNQIVDHAGLERGVDHRRAAVLDDDRLAAEALEVGEGLGEHGDAVEGGVGLVCEGRVGSGGGGSFWCKVEGSGG